MNKESFLNELSSRLGDLPQSERERLIDYYSEMIGDRTEDGMSEEEAVNALGDMDCIVKNIMLDCSLPTLIKARVSDSRKKISDKWLWLALVIISSPVWFPVLGGFASAAFGIYVGIWAVIFAIFAVLFALSVSCVACLIGGAVFALAGTPAVGLCIIGAALICCGIMLFALKPAVCIAKALVNLTVWFVRKIKSLFISRK